MQKIENDTLLFFFGILSAVGVLHFIGFLAYINKLYGETGSTAANIGVGFISAIASSNENEQPRTKATSSGSQ